MIRRGDVVWVDFGSPRGSEPAKIRPALVMQANWLLDTNIATVMVVPLTSNVELEAFPGNVLVPTEASGLERDSVALVAQIAPVDRRYIEPYAVGHLPAYLMTAVTQGLRLVSDM